MAVKKMKDQQNIDFEQLESLEAQRGISSKTRAILFAKFM